MSTKKTEAQPELLAPEDSTTAAIVTADSAPPAAMSPLQIIADACTNPDVDPDKLRALLEVKRDWEADEARKAFAASLARFQAAAPIVEKGDTANGRPYARIDRLWRTVRPLMDDCGLAVSWTSCVVSDGTVQIEGVLTHRDGHAQPIRFDLPLPDAIKGQNASQRMGSAVTYAKRYCICSALNIVTGDDDTDGGKSGEPITREQCAELERLFRDAAMSEARQAKFWAWAECACMDDLAAEKYEAVHTMLAKAVRARENALVDTEETLP